MIVDIDLGDRQRTGHLFGDLFESRGNLFARTAPFRPEVHKDRAAGIDHISLEGFIADRFGRHGTLLGWDESAGADSFAGA